MLIINYDEPINAFLSVDGINTKLPAESRNFSRDRFSTVSGTVAFDSSYPTGGYANTNPKFGLKVVNGVIFEDVNGYATYYNKTTDKIQVFTTAGTEVANTTNLSTLTAVYFEAKGRQY